MMTKLLFVGAILLIALPAMAADAVTGKWRMEQEFNGNTRVSTLDLQADGAKLTGSLTQPGFGPPGDTPPPPVTTAIANGKVDGNNITFDLVLDFNGNSFTLKFEGAVTGPDMKVKITIPTQDGDTRTFEAAAKKQ